MNDLNYIEYKVAGRRRVIFFDESHLKDVGLGVVHSSLGEMERNYFDVTGCASGFVSLGELERQLNNLAKKEVQ